MEITFTWPGLGRLALERALAFDQPVILGITTITTVMVLAGALLADVCYAYLDPRIRPT